MENLIAYMEVFAVAIWFRYSVGQDIALDYKMLFLLSKHFLAWMSAKTISLSLSTLEEQRGRERMDRNSVDDTDSY